MTFRSTALVLATVAAAAVAPRAEPLLQTRDTAVVIGQVVDATTRKGIPGAIVRLISGTTRHTRIADDRGRFYFRGLPAGTFAIVATKTRFIDGAYGKRRAGGAGVPLILGAGEIVADVEIPLFRPATINGVVVDEGNEPAIGVRVIAYRRQFLTGGWRYVPAGTALTNDRGEYRIFGLIPGEYVVSVPRGVISVPILSLEEIGQTGRGNPAIGMLITMNGVAGSGQALANMMQPDAEERNAVLLPPTPTPPPAVGRREFTYPTQYFPGVDVPGRATPVAVGSGDDYGGVSFQLRPVTAVRIEGIAVGPDGPAAHQMLRLLVADGDDHGFGTETAATVTAADGTFTFARVPTGHYRIEARSAVSLVVSPNGGRPTTLAGFPLVGAATPEMQIFTRDFDDIPLGTATRQVSDDALWGREDVSVHDEDVHDVIVRLSPPVILTGRLTFNDRGQPPTPEEISRVQVSLEPADGSAMPLAPARAEPTGRFTLSGVVPGQYFVRVTGVPRGWHLRTGTAGGRDVIDRPLDVADQDRIEIAMSFETRGTTITGTARDSRSLPVRGATVLVFPVRESGSGVANSHRVREVRTSRYGVFSIDGLPPGEYFVAAVDDAAAEGWQDARSLQQLRRVATRLTLGDGGRASLDLWIR